MKNMTWETKKIGDIAEIHRGASPRPIQNFLSEKGMPWVKIADATADTSRFISSTKECIKEAGVSRSVVVKPGTLIVSNSATPGLPKIMQITACVHDGWLVFSNYKGVLRDFLYYKFIDIRKILTNQANGSVFQNLKTDIVKNFEITLPSTDIQEKIVSFLQSIDAKLENITQINHNLEEQAKAIFKSWFVDFEPFKNENLVDSAFGMVPICFKVCKNGDLPIFVTDYVANGSFATLKANVTLYQESNYAYFIRNTDLKSGTFEVFVDKHSYNFLSKTKLFGGEVIISNVGDVGSVFLCPALEKPMTLGNNIIMLKSENIALQNYLYIWFKWFYGQNLIQGIKSGSAQPKFNKTDFKALSVLLPPSEKLHDFYEVIGPMFQEMEAGNKESKRLAQLRDTLLPKLMSGEIDVSEVEI